MNREAEIERLRAALQQIADTPPEDAIVALEIARRALLENSNDED